MTCKRTYFHAPSVSALIVAVLTVLVALTTPGTLASTPPLFLPAVSYSTGGLEAGFVTVADVNGDDKPDLIVANTYYSNTIGVLLGNGDGTFQPVVTYDSGGGYPTSIGVVDVNGDGKPDLVVAKQGQCYACAGNGLVAVLLGNGDGTFGPAVTYDSGGGLGVGSIGGGPSPGQLAAADLNGDGKPDIVVASCIVAGLGDCGFSGGNGIVGVLVGNGDGTFNPVVTYDSGGRGAVSVAIADVNGDGKADVLVSNNECTLSNCAPGLVSVLLGNGDGTLQPAVAYPSGALSLRQVAIADVNGDGKLDVLVGGCGLSDCFAANGVVSVLLGNGNGTFQPATTYRSGGRLADGIAISDLDGDGRLDIAVANVIDSSVSVFLGNGNGTFQLPVTFSSGATLTYSVAVADVNGDRKPDLLVSSNYGLVSDSCFGGLCGVVGVLLNNTTPPDTTPPVITLSATPKGLWPPNGLMRPVTISGTITDTGSGVNASTATYVVTDEYGEIQPTGAITLDPGGSYSFTVLLQASRRGSDFDGRRYMIAVRAKDNAGNGASKTSVVIVPHDQGH